jgi:multiple sugar transport system permease protein
MSARLMRIAGYAAIAIALVCALFPFWWLIATSLKLPVDIFSGASLIPQNPTLDNYERLFVDYDFDAFLINSVGIVSLSVCVSLVLGTLAAYGLARFRFPWGLNEHSLIAALLVRLLPPILLAIPLFITLSEFGLLNTWLGLIIVYCGLNTSFVIWMMQSFFEEVPTEIEEAARVDGDSRLSALRRVVLPLAAPGIAATAIFSVITTYNDFLIALSLTSTPDAQTVPVGVSTLIGKIKIEWGPMAAAGVIGALPIVLFALLVQRHFVRGLTFGALK